MKSKKANLLEIGDAIHKRTLKNLDCGDLSEFFEAIETARVNTESINQNILAYQSEILEKVRNSVRIISQKT